MPISKRTAEATKLQPYWKSECGQAAIYLGDCREILLQLEPEQFHAVVTDPPYELGFMSKRWDGTGVAYDLKTWKSILQVAKQGAHLLSFGGSRTYHRMTCAIEDAEWEIRDCIMWVYGTGYPKSMDVSKAIDKELGAERRKTRTPMSPNGNVMMDGIGSKRPWKELAKEVGYHEHDSDDPVTEESKEWYGWGTALKPTYEPVVLARKPLEGTVAQCVMANGTGALNVDACRVGTTGGDIIREVSRKISSGSGVYKFNDDSKPSSHMNGEFTKITKDGRWPANLIHDNSDEVVRLFREGAERFFYTPKAGEDDRPHGKNGVIHPTVKPLDLMRYLVRLVCVRGGRVLDPFCGTGSTGVAAVLEGMEFVGVELSKEYADLAVGKIKLALESLKPTVTSSRPEVKRLRGS